MNRDRVIRLVFLIVLSCFCGISFSFAQELKLTPEYYHIKDFKLKSGMVIEDLKIEYARLGTAKKDSQGNVTNAVVFCHGFSGNYAQIALFKGMVGPDKPFDTDKYFFILPTAIGSPGSSCPLSLRAWPKVSQVYRCGYDFLSVPTRYPAFEY